MPGSSTATQAHTSASAKVMHSTRHWRRVRCITFALALVWACVAVLLPGTVQSLHGRGLVLGGFPLAYWLTAQGALLAFVAIVVGYALWMERLDARYRDEAPPPEGGDTGAPHGG